MALYRIWHVKNDFPFVLQFKPKHGSGICFCFFYYMERYLIEIPSSKSKILAHTYKPDLILNAKAITQGCKEKVDKATKTTQLWHQK